MMNGTARPQPSARGSRMTMRVYTVDRYGRITQERGTVTVPPRNEPLPLMMSTAYPCACPRHRSEQGVRP